MFLSHNPEARIVAPLCQLTLLNFIPRRWDCVIDEVSRNKIDYTTTQALKMFPVFTPYFTN